MIFELIIIGCVNLLSNSNADQPLSVCSETHPFRLTENKCANFAEICFKQGDDQCNQLQNACKQCPPEKLTYIMMNEISRRIDRHNKLFLVIIVLIFVLFLVLLVENRFKLITKICLCVRRKDKTKYNLLKSRKLNSDRIQNFHETSLVKLEKAVDQGRVFKFEINEEQNPIELLIYYNDNIVRIKKSICKRMSRAEPNYYKIMKLKYKESILDDNDYLLSCVACCDEAIMFNIDYSIIAENIVVLHIDGIIKRDTELIQMSIFDTFDKLIKIISKINNNQNNILLYKKSKNPEKYEELKSNSTLELSKLRDNDYIKVVTKCEGGISISSIFDDRTPFHIKFINTERVSSIIDKIKLELKSDNFLLIFNNQCLKADQFIFQYNINEDAEIKYCLFYSIESIITEGEIKKEDKTKIDKGNIILKERIDKGGLKVRIVKGGLFEVFKAIDKYSKKEIAVKQYDIPKMNPSDYKSSLEKELTKFVTIKSHPRFAQLFGVYKSNLVISISMELMNGGSLKNQLDKHQSKEIINNKQLTIKWSKQILEALYYLHDHGIVHGCLSTSNILFDGNKDLKLSSFNLLEDTKYDKKIQFKAPEMLNKKPFSNKIDVWSFGVILVQIIIGKTFNPYSKIKGDTDKIIYEKDDNIDYKFPEKTFEELKIIVEYCLVDNPINRTTVKQLLTNNTFRLN